MVAGFITVFINGVPTEVPNGPLDMKSMFGQDAMLVHSSGVAVPFNEYGFSLQSLQMGESYFLVSLEFLKFLSNNYYMGWKPWTCIQSFHTPKLPIIPLWMWKSRNYLVIFSSLSAE